MRYFHLAQFGPFPKLYSSDGYCAAGLLADQFGGGEACGVVESLSNRCRYAYQAP